MARFILFCFSEHSILILCGLLIAGKATAGDPLNQNFQTHDHAIKGLYPTKDNLQDNASGQLKTKKIASLKNLAIQPRIASDNLLPLFSLAEEQRKKGDYVNEAATYQKILQQIPNNKNALRGRAFAVMRMGALHLAAHLTDQTPDIFSKEERLVMQQASAGRSIKWGTFEGKAGIGQQRFRATDKSLEKINQVNTMHSVMQDQQSRSSRYSRYDQIVALRDRVKMTEVITHYESLVQQGWVIPAYALAAVADAYLYEHKPEQARDLYIRALDLSKHDRDYPNREWQLNLVSAYIDACDFAAASALSDRLVNEIPPVLNKGLRGVEVDNEFYEDARINQAYARLMADRYEEGEVLVDNILHIAPFNISGRLAKADLYQLRDQPRTAQEKYVSVLVDDPGNMSASSGIAETAIALDDTPVAMQHLDTLKKNYPESNEVKRLIRLFNSYQAPTLTVTSGWGSSPTGLGTRGAEFWNVDALLQSSLFNQQWRVFTHTFNAEARFSDDKAIRRRIGLGADYRSTAWRFNGEINQDQTQFADYGFRLGGSWLPNDHWAVDLEYELNSNNIPLRASGAGISMNTVKSGLNYIVNEARSIGTSFVYSKFTDGNNRYEAGANWQERWWSGPLYKLDTTLGVFASDNSLFDAPYFNPRQDLSLEAQMNNEWTLWRDYRRSFKNRLILGVGHYWQKGFSSGMTGLVRYEHEWTLDPYRTLNYGAAYEVHPYDGVNNETTSVFCNLNWHF